MLECWWYCGALVVVEWCWTRTSNRHSYRGPLHHHHQHQHQYQHQDRRLHGTNKNVQRLREKQGRRKGACEGPKGACTRSLRAKMSARCAHATRHSERIFTSPPHREQHHHHNHHQNTPHKRLGPKSFVGPLDGARTRMGNPPRTRTCAPSRAPSGISRRPTLRATYSRRTRSSWLTRRYPSLATVPRMIQQSAWSAMR